ncbi:MAG: hypothetical protein ABJP34_00365 [Erythrobacter sp.]
MIRTFLLVSAAAALSATGLGAKDGEPALSGYVGKYVFDEVSGTKFLNHKSVRMGVLKNAPSALQERVLGNAVSSPIKEHEGMVLYNGCQPRECADRNWSIAVSKDGQRAAICHFEKGQSQSNGWYVEGKRLMPVTQTCPSGRQPAVAANVIIHVTGKNPWANLPEG